LPLVQLIVKLYVFTSNKATMLVLQIRSSDLHLVASFTCSDCDKGRMTRALIKQGAEVDARDASGRTPLMACTSKSVATVLLDHGAELNAVSYQDKATCLIYAAQRGNLPLVQLFLRKGACLSGTANGDTALHIACQRGFVDIVKALLTAGAPTRGTFNPLLLAAISQLESGPTPPKSAATMLLLAKLLVHQLSVCP
jgi:ankyrin repeat protein